MRHKDNNQRGFTLIELLVVISIFVITSTMVMFNYSNFRSSVSLENLSQDIALTLRKAQVFALGVSKAGNQFPGYGVHFRILKSSLDSAHGNEKSFVFFADIPSSIGVVGDQKYNQDPADLNCDSKSLQSGHECVDVGTITSTDVISQICTTDISGANICSLPSDPFPSTLDIVFTRPNPDANFCITTLAASSCTNSNATITVMSDTGVKKVITVWNTGQISVK